MARKKEEPEVSVPMTQADYLALQRLSVALENMSVRKITRILLRHAIWHPEAAFGQAFREALAGADLGEKSPKVES